MWGWERMLIAEAEPLWGQDLCSQDPGQRPTQDGFGRPAVIEGVGALGDTRRLGALREGAGAGAGGARCHAAAASTGPCRVERPWTVGCGSPQGKAALLRVFSEPRVPPSPWGLCRDSSGDGAAQAGIACPSGKRRSEASAGAWTGPQGQDSQGQTRDPQPRTQPGDPLCPGPRPPLSRTLSSAPGPGGLRVLGAPPPSSPGSVLPWTLAQAPCPVTVSQEAGASGSSEAGSRPARGHLVLDSGCAHPSLDPSPCGLCRDHALPLARRVGGAQALAAAGQARSRAEGGKGHKAGHRPGLWGWSHSARAPPFSRATP